MMLPTTVLVALATSLMTQVVSAHPEELFDKRAHLDEMTRHHVVAEVNSRALQACADQPRVKARRQQAIARRIATFERLRQERNLANGKSSTSLLERSRPLTEHHSPFLAPSHCRRFPQVERSRPQQDWPRVVQSFDSGRGDIRRKRILHSRPRQCKRTVLCVTRNQ